MRSRRHRPGAAKRRLSDRELLASAWRDLSRAPATYSGRSTAIRSAVFAAKFPSQCERCGSPISVGQDVRFHLDFSDPVHDGCNPPRATARATGAGASPPPRTAARVKARPPRPCPDCHLEHGGECW